MRYSMHVLFAAAIALGIAAPTLGQVINEDRKLLPGDGAAGDLFGQSIAIDNGIVAVGATGDDDNGLQSGSAYLFDASTGAIIAKLLPSDGAEYDYFGKSIAMDSGIVAVGAYNDDDNGSASGSAYLLDVSTGEQLFKLLASDGAASDWFGTSIAIDSGVVAVAATGNDDNGSESGSAYLFDASTGQQLFKLLPSDGAGGDWFGYSIAIDNGIVAVGAKGDDDHGYQSGSAYLFDASTGAQIAKLLPSDGKWHDFFGHSIAIDNGIVAVGVPANGDNSYDGSAYLFDAPTGGQIAKLLPSDGKWMSEFGHSIAIDNGVVAVGAIYDGDNGSTSGSAYLFDAATGAQIAKLLPSDGADFDHFGNSIAIDNGVVAGGAPSDDDNGIGSGSAYLFDLTPPCLQLDVINLVAGQKARFAVIGGTPGSRAVTVWGFRPGETVINDLFDLCATFNIAGVKQRSRIIGRSDRTFDADGNLIFYLLVPPDALGMNALFQTAERDTCPDECMSNVVSQIVQ